MKKVMMALLLAFLAVFFMPVSARAETERTAFREDSIYNVGKTALDEKRFVANDERLAENVALPQYALYSKPVKGTGIVCGISDIIAVKADINLFKSKTRQKISQNIAEASTARRNTPMLIICLQMVLIFMLIPTILLGYFTAIREYIIYRLENSKDVTMPEFIRLAENNTDTLIDGYTTMFNPLNGRITTNRYSNVFENVRSQYENVKTMHPSVFDKTDYIHVRVIPIPEVRAIPAALVKKYMNLYAYNSSKRYTESKINEV